MLHARLVETCAECTRKTCLRLKRRRALGSWYLIERAGHKWWEVVNGTYEIESYPSDEYDDVCCQYVRERKPRRRHAVRKTY